MLAQRRFDPESPIRPATADDAKVLAFLINEAGDGIPLELWKAQAEGNQCPMAVGASRAARESGGFSYRNAWVIDCGGSPAAMLLGYRLDDPYPLDTERLPPLIRPVIELEARAAGSWYINALASLPSRRGMGYGSRLLGYAEQQAEHSGADAISLIVSESNLRAADLYHRHGYRERHRLPSLPKLGDGHEGDWRLLIKPL